MKAKYEIFLHLSFSSIAIFLFKDLLNMAVLKERLNKTDMEKLG